MKIIVPCAGRSSRYPDMPPKWMLPDPTGTPMIVRAVEDLEIDRDSLVVTILRTHDEAFGAREGLKRAFGFEVNTVVLDEQTASQSETVAKTLRAAAIEEPFLVKDSDNRFAFGSLWSAGNYVSVASLNDFDVMNARNKSYVTLDAQANIRTIVEKRVTSDLFSVGGYFFTDPAAFLDVFERLSQGSEDGYSELYISAVISAMLEEGVPFDIRRVEGFEDWGTVHEWRRKLAAQQQYFVSVDGFLFERGSRYFKPAFADVRPHAVAIEATRKLGRAGHSITYLSIRPSDLQDQTRQLLSDHGLPAGALVMDCDEGAWRLVGAPHPSLPLVSASAFDVDPNEANLFETLSSADG